MVSNVPIPQVLCKSSYDCYNKQTTGSKNNTSAKSVECDKYMYGNNKTAITNNKMLPALEKTIFAELIWADPLHPN